MVLDIGEDIGALVLHAPESLFQQEVELEPKKAPMKRVHAVVRERWSNGRRLFAAVFPSLEAGEYRICTSDAQAASEVTITGGVVTDTNWPPSVIS